MEQTEADPRRWAMLGVLCLSLLLIVMDNTIVNVAIPTLQRDLDASTSDLQWVVDSYILVFAGLLLTAGSLGDRFGRRGALTAGLWVMGAASLLSAVASSAGQLIATRAVMGVGAALIMPATLSILTNVFTDAKERAQAIAIWSGTAGMAIALGPVTGGWLLEHFWWGSVFLVNVPVVILAIVLGRAVVPTSRDPQPRRIDLGGALLSITAVTALVYAIIEGPHGWTEPQVVGGFVAAAALLGGFVWWENRVAQPMLDLAFFRSRRFSAATGAITIIFFALIGSFFLLTQYLQFVLGYSALEAGLRLLPLAAVMMVAAPLSARVVERVGTKAVVATGLGVAAAGLVLAASLTAGSGYGSVLTALLVIGLGMGLTMAPATESIMGALPPSRAGVGSAVNDTTRELGGAIGVAVLGSILTSTYGSKVSDAIAGLPLPRPAAEAATDQLGAAVAMPDRFGAAGQTVADAARSAFVDGMGTAMLVGAVVLVAGAALVLAMLPSRAEQPAEQPAEEPDEALIEPALEEVPA